MRVGFYQFDVMFGQKARNLQKVKEALLSADFELMVLPELFSSGYPFASRPEAAAHAEPVPGGATTQTLVELARQKRAYIVGGVLEADAGLVYSTAVVVGPQGYVGKHRKIHLTQGELLMFDRGNRLDVFDLDGVTIGVAVCFENWFPETPRLLAVRGAQIICNPANFNGRLNLDMSRTRAAENRVYTVTANRIGIGARNETLTWFRGQSQIVRFDGKLIHRAQDRESLVVVEIDPEETKDKSFLGYDDLASVQAFYSDLGDRPLAGFQAGVEWGG